MSVDLWPDPSPRSGGSKTLPSPPLLASLVGRSISPWVELVLLVPTGLACMPSASFSRGMCGSQTKNGLQISTSQRFYRPSTGDIYVPTTTLYLGTPDNPLPSGYVDLPADEAGCGLENAVGCTYAKFLIDPAKLRLSRNSPEFNRYADRLGLPHPLTSEARRELFDLSRSRP